MSHLNSRILASLALSAMALLLLPSCITYRPGTRPESYWAVSNSRQAAASGTQMAQGGPDGGPVVISRRRVAAPGESATPMPAPTAQPQKGSGFLDDYDRLSPAPDNPGALMWQAPNLDLRNYDVLLFDPIRIVPLPGSKVGELSDELKKRATDAFMEIMLEEITPYYDVVDKPGEHVLRVQLAITDIEPTEKTADGTKAVHVGGAALEAKLVDGLSDEVLLTFVDRIEGSESGEVAEEKWRAAEGAFREWAKGLLEFLDSWQ